MSKETKTETKITLEALREKKLCIFRAERQQQKMEAQAEIAKSNVKFISAEFDLLLINYKAQEGKPLDKDIHLMTGESIG